METLKQRIEARRAVTDRLLAEMQQCNARIEAEKQRQRELAARFNDNTFGYLRFLIEE
jgi:hypothetical protein